MKWKKIPDELRVIIAGPFDTCIKCQYIRVGEPCVERLYVQHNGDTRTECTCWRCCRDHDSTLLIFRKWPLAFNRRAVGPYYHLEWRPGVKLLRNTDAEVKLKD